MTTRQRGTLAAAILGSSIVFVDGTLVFLAIPRIGSELSGTILGRLEAQTYITSGFLATLAAFLVLGGAIGDFFGRRRIFVLGLTGFGATSIICGIAPSLELLVVGRVLQGIAGALLVPGSLAIITGTFDGASRARAFGMWTAVTSALMALGPPIGGIVVETIGWRFLFLVNVPLGIAGAWLAIRYMDEMREPGASGSFDWLGAVTAVVALGGLGFGATRGQQAQWQDPVAFAALGLGAAALVVFPVLMARRRHPLVPLGLFRNREFSAVNLSTLLVYGALYTYYGFQSLFLQNTLGYSPLGAALATLPPGILLTILSTRVGSLAGRIGVRPFLVIGPLLMALGVASWLRVPATSTPWLANLADASTLIPPLDLLIDPLPAVIVYGVGISLLVAPLTTALMGSVPVRNAGLASAINNALSRVGQPLIAAAVFIIVSGAFYSALAASIPGTDPSSPELRAAYEAMNLPPADAPADVVAAARAASTDAFHLAMAVCAALMAAGAVVNAIWMRPAVRASGPAATDGRS